MAQAKTSEDLSLVHPANQLDIEKILSNWDDYLAPASMGIFIMSQLLICSTRVKDFAINRIDKTKINLIIHPLSYCTTLVQIANDYYETFMLAHNNMDKIQCQMAQVPDDVKECVELIQFNDKNAIEKFLPRRLERIKEAAADGLKYSTQVRDSFDRLNRLIQQVILAIQTSKGVRTAEIRKRIEDEITEKKTRQEQYNKRQNDLLHKEMEGAQEAEQRTQKNSEEASDFRVEDFFTLGITLAARNATSTSNKKQAEKWLQQLKQEAKQVEEERQKVCNDYENSLKNQHINVGKEVSTDEMIKLLQDGTKKLGELHEKWAGMTMYFEYIYNHIGIVLNKYLVDFVGDANDVQHDISLLEFMTDSIEKSLTSSIKSHHIAATYVKVSDNYIMTPLKRMHGMLSIESAKLEETQNDLLESCQQAMQGIKEMGNKERNQTIREIENRVQNIQN